MVRNSGGKKITKDIKTNRTKNKIKKKKKNTSKQQTKTPNIEMMYKYY